MDGLVVWITGLPGSGKSTVADAIKGRFPEFVVLNMDDLRRIVTPEPAYSLSERDLVYRAIVYAAKTLSELGHDVIIDATGNMRKWRELARQYIPNFAEIYLKCSVGTCSQREALRSNTRGAPKDIYKKGEAGWPVPGVRAPYEAPLHADMEIDTETSLQEDFLPGIYDFISDRLASKK